MPFREISTRDLTMNVFERIGTDWMLVTAGDENSHNTMTASWGQFGFLWNKPVATVYVRPQRYTREFMEREEHFSLSFFAPGERRQALNLLGTKSGRDGDKISEASLHVQMLEGAPAFEEAQLVVVCRKLYAQDMQTECFLDEAVVKTMYPRQDFHRMYVGEIIRVYENR